MRSIPSLGILVVLGVVLPFAVIQSSLSQTLSELKRSFEVVSVKRNTSGAPGGGPVSGAGGRFVANNASLTLLLNWAYRASNGKPYLPSQIIGAPSWATTDHFDIQGKPEGEVRSIPLEEMQAMVRSMLEDRFKLKSHRETRELPVYNLTVAKPGKIKLSEDQSPTGTPTVPPGFDPSKAPPRGLALNSVVNSGGTVLSTMVATAVPISSLLNMLQGQVGRLVTNKTNLSGLFDFNLKFIPDSQTMAAAQSSAPTSATMPAPSPAPSLFTALQEELGLRLESAKGPVEVLVIDGVQKPSEN